MFKPFQLIALIALMLATVSATQAQVIKKPLPSRFFSEKTLVLARVKVASANVEHFYKAMGAVIPKGVTAQMEKSMQQAIRGGEQPSGSLVALGTLRKLVDNPQFVAQLRKRNPGHPLNLMDLAAGKLLAVDINAVYVVLMQESGQSGQVPFFMVPQEGSSRSGDAQARRLAFTEVAKLIGAKVVTDEGWLVAGMQGLPQPGDEFSLDEDAFLDALQSNPEHDLMVAFVPPAEMRSMARKEWEKMIKNSPSHEKQIVPFARNLIKVMDGDWFYGSVQLGDQPSVRLSVHFADAAKPKSLASNLNQLVATMPSIVKVEHSSNSSIQKIREANSKAQLQIFQLLRFGSKGTYLTCDLNTRTLVRMVEKMLEIRNEPVDNSAQSIDPAANYRK